MTVNGKESSIVEEFFDKTSERIAWLVNKTWLSRDPRCHYIIYVGYHTRKITLPVIPLMVPVTLPIPVMSDACTGIVRPFILLPF